MSAAKRARIYIRESDEKMLKGYSPDQMVEQCRQKAAQLGAEVVHVAIEAAKRDELDPPGLMAELDAAERGEYELLISWDMLRLTGDLAKHLAFRAAMAETRVQIQYVTVEFPDSEEGELFEIMAGGLSRYERLKTRRRTQNGIRGKLAKRQPIGNGTTPYGLKPVKHEGRTVGYAPDDAGKIDVLRRIVRELGRRSMQAICDDLNAERVPTPSGRGRWSTGIVSRLLANGTYFGSYEFGRVRRIPGRRPDGRRIYRSRKNPDEHVTRFAIDPVIPADDIALARAGLAERKRRGAARRPEADDPYALRGRLTCGHCGGALSCAVNNGYRRYLCLRAYGREVDPATRCPLPEVPADALEAAAWAAFAARIRDRPALERALAAASDPGDAGRRYEELLATNEREVARLAARIEHANDVMLDFGRGTEQYDDAREKSARMSARKRELEASLSELRARRPTVLTADGAARAREAWACLEDGLEEAGRSASRQRTLYETVGLTGTVAREAAGERVGRHRYALGWAMQVALSGGATDASRSVVRWDTPDGPPRLVIAGPDRAA